MVCDTCKHWDDLRYQENAKGHPSLKDPHWGYCRYNPPVVVYLPGEEETRTIWPETQPHEGCSKHVRKDATNG